MVKDKQVVTPRRIDEAKAEAQRLADLAYGPQPVKQPDGTALALCWAGRLHRALELANEAQRVGAAQRLALVEQAIAQLTAQLHAADNVAQLAASEYAALCVLAGRTPEELALPVCTCVGCRAGQRMQVLGDTAGQVRHAVWALLGAPAVGEEPPLLSLVREAGDEAQRERLWYRLKNIADAMERYAAACAEFAVSAEWNEVWR